MGASSDPATPDGPEPHAFPAWPYAWEKVLPLPEGEALFAPAKAAPAQAGAWPMGDVMGAYYRLALAPYALLWTAAAANFNACASLCGVGRPGASAPAAVTASASKPRSSKPSSKSGA
jgi:hypothetical protein